MTLPDMRDCECAQCGWRGRVRLTSYTKTCGACGIRHFISPSQWLDHLDGGRGVLVLDAPDRRGKRGTDRGPRKRPVRR